MTACIRKRAAIILTLMILMFSFALTAQGCTAKKDSKVDAKPAIKVSQAKVIALKDAKVKAGNTIITRRRLEYDTGKPLYRICFLTEKKNETIRYEYLVNGTTGDIESIGRQIQNTASANLPDEKPEEGDKKKNTSRGYIGVKGARVAALEDAGLESIEVVFTSVKLTNRGGRMVYETRFQSEEIHYGFDIDAFSGNVIRREVEYVD